MQKKASKCVVVTKKSQYIKIQNNYKTFENFFYPSIPFNSSILNVKWKFQKKNQELQERLMSPYSKM